MAEERKNTFYTVPASELANWRGASASLYDEWIAEVTAKGNDGKALLAKAQALVKKYVRSSHAGWLDGTGVTENTPDLSDSVLGHTGEFMIHFIRHAGLPCLPISMLPTSR